jgi:hypothetical protein
VVEVRAVGQRERPREAAVLALVRIDRRGLLLVLAVALARDLDAIPRGGDLEVFLHHARYVGFEHIGVLVLGHVEAGAELHPLERWHERCHLAERIPAQHLPHRAQWVPLGQLSTVALLHDLGHRLLLL